MGMLSVVSECLPGPKVSPNSPRYTNCTCWDSRTISCAPFLIALSSSGNRYDNVSRESSVHSMISISSPLMKSIKPIARSTEGRQRAGWESSILWVFEAPMTDAHGLHCPNCGAAAGPHAPRCSYCRARLATISCQGCFALMFDGSAFCPACGARSARADRHPAAALCPACRAAMARVVLGDLGLLECGACDGVWLDAVEFERICADREAQGAVLHRWQAHAPRPPLARVQYRPC